MLVIGVFASVSGDPTSGVAFCNADECEGIQNGIPFNFNNYPFAILEFTVCNDTVYLAFKENWIAHLVYLIGTILTTAHIQLLLTTAIGKYCTMRNL